MQIAKPSIAGWPVSILVCPIAQAQSPHNYALCNVVNRSDGRATSIEPLKFDVRVDKRIASNIHGEQSRHSRRVILTQDTGASMRSSNAQEIFAEVIKSLIASATADDQIALVDFSDQYYLDIPPTNAAHFPDQYNRPKLQAKISPRGGTALFDAVIASASLFSMPDGSRN